MKYLQLPSILRLRYTRIPSTPSLSTPSLRTPTPPVTWRPWPLRPPFLLSFIGLLILLALTIELVLHSCTQHGCHIFGQHSDVRIPAATNFAYNQLPIVLSLGLSLLWALPHHDIVRLEPYFQMSVREGATARDSLFLNYPYTIALYVPIKAARRRHPIVLLSSLVLILMNFLIVPLISGIFTEDKIIEVFSTTSVLATLAPSPSLSTKFTYTAYDSAWLGGALPPFTTETYALLPVQGQTGSGYSNENWTAETVLYEAEFDCKDAGRVVLGYTGDRSVGVNITSIDEAHTVRLCDLDAWFDKRLSDWELKYCDEFTEFVTPWTSISYQIPGHLDTYMVAWASGSTPAVNNNDTRYPLPVEITALFCKTSYYKQAVTASFKMPSKRIIDVVRHGERSPFQRLASFEQVLNGTLDASTSAEYRDSTGRMVGFGYKPLQPPDVDSQLIQRLGGRPNAFKTFYQNASLSVVYMQNRYALSGFALFDERNETLPGLLEGARLGMMYEKAVKRLFAIAFATELVVEEPKGKQVQITKRMATRGFVVDKLWARGTEAGLGVIVVMAVVLSILIRRRKCMLDGEPNSLAAGLRLLAGSEELCKMMENSEFSSPKEMRRVMDAGGRKYRLDLVPGKGPRVEVLVADDSREVPKLPVRPITWNEKPWALRIGPGISFLTIFILITVILIATFVYARNYNGLPMPGTRNSFSYKFLFSYIPLAIGMGIEPVLITLGASQAMIGPYKALTRGRASAKRSLIVDFDKSPPHFQLLRALRSGEYTLSAITIAILLSNVLAVALVGLYVAADAHLGRLPELTVGGEFNVSGKEMFYLLDKLQVDKVRQTWTTDEWWVVPRGRKDGEYESVGIGVDVRCELVEQEKIRYTCIPPNGTEVSECKKVDFGDWNHVLVLNPCGTDGPEETYLKYAWQNPSGDTLLRTTNCSDTFFPLWVERPGDPNPKNASIPYLNQFKSVVLNCTSADRIVNLTATVEDSQVLHTSHIRSFSPDEIARLYTLHTPPLTRSFLSTIDTGIQNTITTHYIAWFSYLMACITPAVVRDSPIVTHLPDTNVVAEAFSKVYRRLFAINTRLFSNQLISTGLKPRPAGDRVYVSNLMFTISLSILLFTTGVIVSVYFGQERNVVGHLPSSLAGVWAHLYASNAKGQCAEVRGANPKQRAEELRVRGGRYGYGRFGEGHVGVYSCDGLEDGMEMMRWLEGGERGREVLGGGEPL